LYHGSEDQSNQKGGLGYHLYKSLGNEIPVIGVAKTSFKDNNAFVIDILRGKSKNPLFITSIGIDSEDAAECIKKMHGEFRMPTLLTRPYHKVNAGIHSGHLHYHFYSILLSYVMFIPHTSGIYIMQDTSFLVTELPAESYL